MVNIIPLRNRVYMADLGCGEKPWVAVSNNARNNSLDSVLVARITATRKTPRSTIVQLGKDDPLVGFVLCDDIEQLYREDLRRDVGALSVRTMVGVGMALKAAFALL